MSSNDTATPRRRFAHKRGVALAFLLLGAASCVAGGIAVRRVVVARHRCIASIGGADDTVCALLVNGSVQCFGDKDRRGTMGEWDPRGTPVAAPVAMRTIAGGSEVCGISEVAGEVWCWGRTAQPRLEARLGRHVRQIAVG